MAVDKTIKSSPEDHSLIHSTNHKMSCRNVYAGQVVRHFKVKTGVCQLPTVAIPLPPGHCLDQKDQYNRQQQWRLWPQLDDLDFADNLVLLLQNYSRMQDKSTQLKTTSARTGLKINKKKTELMKMNTTFNTSITVNGESIKEMVLYLHGKCG
jgi:hypothetical protein